MLDETLLEVVSFVSETPLVPWTGVRYSRVFHRDGTVVVRNGSTNGASVSFTKESALVLNRKQCLLLLADEVFMESLADLFRDPESVTFITECMSFVSTNYHNYLVMMSPNTFNSLVS